jgi:excisionase family DNA binding protein
VSERTIRRWAAEGRITFRKAGRRLLVNPLEVSELVARRSAAGRLPKTIPAKPENL